MTEHYGAATLTPVTAEVKREIDVKSEPTRINNGYGATTINVVTQPQQAPQLAAAQVAIIPQPAASSSSVEAPPTDYTATKEPPYWHSGREQQCCLVENGRRCLKPAGNASYSKRIQKTVAQRKLKLHMDNSARHIYICDYHKNVIQSVRAAKARRRKDSEDCDSGEMMDVNVHHHSAPSSSGHHGDQPEVDLFQLQVNTLRRYKKHFKVPSRPGLNKAQLADSLMRHFKTIPVVEKEALTFFIYMIKTRSSKFDREQQQQHHRGGGQRGHFDLDD